MAEITEYLSRWKNGDASALEQLTPLVYDELRTVAAASLRRGGSGQQVTELVGQLFVELLQRRQVDLPDRKHFYAFSARIMRNILTDHVRAAKAAKRGGELAHVPLDPELAWTGHGTEADTLDLNAAMTELEGLDPDKVRALELRYFFGLTAEETAEVLEVSKATVDREIRFALSWLHSKLHPIVP